MITSFKIFESKNEYPSVVYHGTAKEHDFSSPTGKV